MKKFLIITNENKDLDLSVTKTIITYIESKGGKCLNYITQKTEMDEKKLASYGLEQKGIECVIVLGGDGTLVRASRNLVDYRIPLIGVNLGTLGYLCELEKQNILPAIDRLMEDEYQIENRMMLKAVFPKKTYALNDIVIHRSSRTQIIRLRLVVDGEFLSEFNADGIIVSTATGSTGYSMSAGGPIVDPKTDIFVITPINPHDISSRSIVIGSDSRIEITLCERRPEKDEAAVINSDGDFDGVMKVSDHVIIERANTHVRILRLNDLSFLQILRKKMRET